MMKSKGLKLGVFLLAGSLMFSSCIGSFSLWNKVLRWNQHIDNKFVNELVFICLHIVPVYEIAGFIDAVVLNTIEFWSGTNPMTANVGKTQTIFGNDGKQYLVKTLKDGYDITKPNGEIVNFTYNKSDNAWYMNAKGKKAELFKFNNDGTAQITLQSGERMNVALNGNGIFEAKMAVQGGNFFAAR
jgi:hypothetical protein